MKISLVSDSITVIELSPEEMTQYDFAFEKSDYSSPHTRRVLWEIIDDASRITGKEVEVSKGLEIDFLPDIKGGGLLIICQGKKDNIKGHSLPGTIILESENIDSVLDFANSTPKKLRNEQSALYKNEDAYRLIISSDSSVFYYLANEFYLYENTEPYCEDSTLELWDCLIEKDALKILSGTASKK